MKRYLLFVLILLFCSNVYAGQWAIGARGSAIRFDDDNLNPDFHYQGGVNLGYFMKYAGVELESTIGHFKTERTLYTNGSSFNVFGTMFNLQARLPINNKLTLYGVYGFGEDLFFNKKLDRETLKAGASRAAKYGAGAEWSLNKHWDLNGEATYHYSDTGEKSTIDTWSWVYSLGLKYKF